MDLSWLPDDGGTGHMPPSKEVVDFWKKVKEHTDFKTLVEIGFNAGHSSSIILTLFEDTKILSHDIGQFDITLRNGELVKDKFKNRFDLVIKNSLSIQPSEINGNDVLFIDGGHDYEIVSKDIELFINSDIQYLVLDDMQHRGVKKAYANYLNNDNYQLIHKQHYEAILPSHMRNTGVKNVIVPVYLIKKIK